MTFHQLKPILLGLLVWATLMITIDSQLLITRTDTAIIADFPDYAPFVRGQPVQLNTQHATIMVGVSKYKKSTLKEFQPVQVTTKRGMLTGWYWGVEVRW